MALSREEIVARFNRPRQVREVEVPELGSTVFIRQMNGAERERMELACRRDRDKDVPTQRARVVQATLCDPDGNLLFLESDLSGLNTLPWKALDRIADEANEFNGLTDAAREAAGKNSGIPRPPASSSGSPSDPGSSGPTLLSGSPLPS